MEIDTVPSLPPLSQSAAKPVTSPPPSTAHFQAPTNSFLPPQQPQPVMSRPSASLPAAPSPKPAASAVTPVTPAPNSASVIPPSSTVSASVLSSPTSSSPAPVSSSSTSLTSPQFSATKLPTSRPSFSLSLGSSSTSNNQNSQKAFSGFGFASDDEPKRKLTKLEPRPTVRVVLMPPAH